MKQYLFVLFMLVMLNSCGYSPEKVKYNRYMVSGERIYEEHCANCHQTDGQGLRGLYPPINGSDYMKDNLNRVICDIKLGSNDSLVVNGLKYNIPMPASGLTTLEIAEVTTFIYNKWDQSKGLIDVKETEKILKECID